MCLKLNVHPSLHVHNAYNKNIEVFTPPFISVLYNVKLLRVASNMEHNTHNKTTFNMQGFLLKLVVAIEFGFVYAKNL
jgi:hypothetical protein